MFRRLLIACICVLTLAVAGTLLWVWQGLKTLDTPIALSEPRLFDVPNGTSFSRLARNMQEQGFVDRSLWLRIHGRLFPDQVHIKAGEYEFTDGMSALDMVQAMVDGETKSWSMQFIEGWTFADLRSALADGTRLRHLTTEWSDDQIMAELGAEGEHPEGRFFPDTYLHHSQDSDLDLMRRAFEKMNRVLEEEWRERAEGLPYDSAYQALIMASIVERETGVPSERDTIAGVFVRRLEKGMRLQTDPTVIYGMGDDYQGRITSRDLRRYTPYNTYRINGLPPTPIALPGREAIHAALHPAEGRALYFVARGDGTHKFSNSLSEHQQAVRQYQLNRRADYRSSPPPQSSEAQP